MKIIIGILSLISLCHCFFIDGKSKGNVVYSISWNIVKNDIVFKVTRNTTLPRETDVPVTKSHLSELYKQHVRPHWFSLLLNSKSETVTMKDSDFIFINNVGDGWSCDISDRYSHHKGVPPKPDETFGGQNNVSLISADLQYSQTDFILSSSCTVSRALDTADPFDVPITDRFIVFGWAYGDLNDKGRPLKHQGTVESKMVNLITGKVRGEKKVARTVEFIFWHAVLMTSSWLVCMIPATFIARYLKASITSWYFIHYRIQAFGFILFLAAIFVAAVDLGWHVPIDIHVIVGFSVFSLTIIQIFFGYMSNALWYEGKPPQVWPDMLHWWLGRLVILGGMVNIVLGIASYEDRDVDKTGIGWSWAYMMFVVYVGYLSVVILLFELRVGQQHEHLMLDSSSDVEELSDNEYLEDELEEKESNDNVALYGKSPVWKQSTVNLLSSISLMFLVISAASLLILIFFA